jgi:hypothetical protein
MIVKWLIDNSGKICTVLGGLAVVGGGICMLLFSSVAIPMGVLIAVGALVVGGVVSGACYLGREHGARSERDRQQTLREAERSAAIDVGRTVAVNSALSAEGNMLSKSANQALIDIKFAAIEARLTSIEGRTSCIEGSQATRFQNEARRELHKERTLNPLNVDQGSDSDSEDTNLLSQQSIFADQTLRQRRVSAANDTLGLGVELRHRASKNK